MLAVKSSALGAWHTSLMEQNTARGVRARVRAELTDEIKAAARRHLATDGANLSLRAIAREMGMVSSALYRYFASRDDLLTALIIDAYNDMGAVAEHADAGVAERADVRARWMAVARALRGWALTNPAEYALLYGTPVPGYAAPADTTAPASRPVWVLASILSDAGPLDDRPLPLGAGLSAEIRQIIETGAPGVSEAVMVRGLIAWTQMFGALNFELFGRINNVIDERDEWFDLQMLTMLDFVGLG
jgi:AcrR family transcriptional regulator